MVRFPQVKDNPCDPSMIVCHGSPYAKHNLLKTSYGKQVGFLTEHTLFFVLEGKKHLHFDDKTVTISAPDLLFLKKGLYVISEFVPSGGKFEALMLFVHEPFLQEFSFLIQEQGIIKGTNDPYSIVPSNTLLRKFSEGYLHYFGTSFPTREVVLKTKLQELFLLLMAAPQKEEITNMIRSILGNRPVDIEYLVKQHLFKPLTLQDFAELSNRSLASFKRDFEKIYCCSPRAWINRQRLSHASGLLRNTAKSVSEIAYACGFESASHFIKLYKREYNITPANARAKCATR